MSGSLPKKSEAPPAEWGTTAYWGRYVDLMPRVRGGKPLALREQAFMLDYIGRLVRECVSLVDRSNHRAVALGAEALGLDYTVAKSIFAELETTSATEIVARHPGFVGFPQDEGFIYFARDDAAHRIKIGFSRNPLLRIEQLSALVGRQLALSGLMSGTMLTEHWVHCQLRGARITGEWFRSDALENSDFAEKVLPPEKVRIAA